MGWGSLGSASFFLLSFYQYDDVFLFLPRCLHLKHLNPLFNNPTTNTTHRAIDRAFPSSTVSASRCVTPSLTLIIISVVSSARSPRAEVLWLSLSSCESPVLTVYQVVWCQGGVHRFFIVALSSSSSSLLLLPLIYTFYNCYNGITIRQRPYNLHVVYGPVSTGYNQ